MRYRFSPDIGRIGQLIERNATRAIGKLLGDDLLIVAVEVQLSPVLTKITCPLFAYNEFNS